MDEDKKRFVTAVSIIVGSCIGAGFLGIPYVAAQAGFTTVFVYLAFFGLMITLVNLYFGEIILSTRGKHQLVGFADKYLGEDGKNFMFLFINVAIFSAILAYMIGVGDSISFLIFGNTDYRVQIGALFGFGMAALLWKGMSSIKTYGKLGVGAIFALFFLTIFNLGREVTIDNLSYVNPENIFLPFGVILFSLIEFYSLPEARAVLRNKEKLLKKAVIFGTIIPIVFYLLFTLVVVGAKGESTPEIATFALGNVFVLIGIFSMFTSYLVAANSLQRSYMLDLRNSKIKAWLKTSILPIIIFLLLQFTDFFSFISVMYIGGVIAGALMVVLVLIIAERADRIGDRRAEYKIRISNTIIIILSLIFLSGAIFEILKLLGVVSF